MNSTLLSYIALGMLLLGVLGGCSGEPRDPTPLDTKDGIYCIAAENEATSSVPIKSPDGGLHFAPVKPAPGFVPRAVDIVPVDGLEAGYRVELKADSQDRNWADQQFVIVAAGKAYYRLSKLSSIRSGGDGVPLPLAVMSFTVTTEAEANGAAQSLRKHFALAD